MLNKGEREKGTGGKGGREQGGREQEEGNKVKGIGRRCNYACRINN